MSLIKTIPEQTITISVEYITISNTGALSVVYKEGDAIKTVDKHLMQYPADVENVEKFFMNVINDCFDAGLIEFQLFERE